MKIKYIVYAVLIIGIGSLIVYRIKKNKSTDTESGGPAQGGSAQRPASVRGVVVKASEFANNLAVTGSIDANEEVQIRSEVQGIVRRISFNEGSNISKGQVLLRIDDSELRAQLAQALTKQNLAAETERRAKLLLEKEAISQEEYDVALADLRSLKAQTQLIRAQLAKTLVTAPFSGRIGLRSVSEGEYLTPTTIVANLVSTNPVKVTFSVPEKYSTMVRNNTRFLFTVAGSDNKYTATVYAIEPRVEASTRTLQLRAKAPNPDGALIPGSFATIQLPLKTVNKAILVPTEAIVPVQNGKTVFISDHGQAKSVAVETSVRTDKDVLVTSGLKEGDTVLTTGIMTLKEGSPVKVKTGGK